MVAREEDQTGSSWKADVSNSQHGNGNTTAVREDLRFDEPRLTEWMTHNVDGFRPPLFVEQFNGGQSNPTYKLLSPDRSYVLRRKPAGPLVAGAHAIEREATILSALASVGFPVARLYGLCDDPSVIGTSFYVMEMVEGRIFWDATFPQVSRRARPDYFDAMNETIARLHALDYKVIGLSDYGRPGNYFGRQIARWSKQYIEDRDAGRDVHMDRLIEWLPVHVPPGDESSIVHGDFRCDNMIFHPSEPRVLALIDWELSTLGHPLADFAYLAMMYRMPPAIVAGLAGADLPVLNIPSEQSFIEAYCRRVGRPSVPHYDFYLAFNFFRLAAIFHGIRGRVVRGTAASAQAQERGRWFPELAKLAWSQAQRAMATG
jgi:aminoglycoside phosphotransferase (APT) family kinase protein